MLNCRKPTVASVTKQFANESGCVVMIYDWSRQQHLTASALFFLLSKHLKKLLTFHSVLVESEAKCSLWIKTVFDSIQIRSNTLFAKTSTAINLPSLTGEGGERLNYLASTACLFCVNRFRQLPDVIVPFACVTVFAFSAMSSNTKFVPWVFVEGIEGFVEMARGANFHGQIVSWT